MKDNCVITNEDFEKLGMKMSSTDGLKVHMTGYTKDTIYKNGVLVDVIEGHNLVVNSFLNLVMCLLKKQSGYTGIKYWAIGAGSQSWDSNIPNPELGATRLTNEIGRIAIQENEISFLDKEYNVVSSPTNILQISHTFGASECNGVWREFGIFGGNATESPNSGIMINKRHHAVITKTSDMTVERIMRFTLNLS